LKLLICAIPKNACTQFEGLTKTLGGVKSSFWEKVMPSKSLEGALEDPTWTKAVFLRDPLDRLVSGWRSKCEPPQEDNGFNCMNFKGANKRKWPRFDRFAGQINRCHNPHFDPQVSFCALDTHFHHYNYKGMITKNYRKVTNQVKTLLRMAMSKSGHTEKSRIEETDEIIEKYFPKDGFTKGNLDHYHNTTDVPKMYKSKTTLEAAIRKYAVDYSSLNLRPPAWVSKSLFARVKQEARFLDRPAKDEEEEAAREEATKCLT